MNISRFVHAVKNFPHEVVRDRDLRLATPISMYFIVVAPAGYILLAAKTFTSNDFANWFAMGFFISGILGILFSLAPYPKDSPFYRPREHRKTTMFKQMFEDPEAEVARASGLNGRRLSRYQVNIDGPLQDRPIWLPDFYHTGCETPLRLLVVVPFLRHAYYEDNPDGMPRKRYWASWDCIVIASDIPEYPVGGHRIVIAEEELVRGFVKNLR